MAMLNGYVSTAQAARRLGVNRVQVANWIRSGYRGFRLPALRVGRSYVIKTVDLDRFQSLRSGTSRDQIQLA
jgi:excisionase family DNA binding protein